MFTSLIPIFRTGLAEIILHRWPWCRRRNVADIERNDNGLKLQDGRFQVSAARRHNTSR
jgi:hypothetical protein